MAPKTIHTSFRLKVLNLRRASLSASPSHFPFLCLIRPSSHLLHLFLISICDTTSPSLLSTLCPSFVSSVLSSSCSRCRLGLCPFLLLPTIRFRSHFTFLVLERAYKSAYVDTCEEQTALSYETVPFPPIY